ncbi:WcaF family extracellular polysaccharide biosynthesis acetyltransferase [Parahaliea maris]
MNLANYNKGEFNAGRGLFTQILWYLLNELIISSCLPGSYWRVFLLRSFGASIGRNVVVKPHVKIKYPWRLRVGHNSWIGENVWIDNLDEVRIGNNVCISQGCYLCTGSHDWKSDRFDLVTSRIEISDSVWVCAMCKLAPGVTIGTGSVISLGLVVRGKVGEWKILTERKNQHFQERARF